MTEMESKLSQSFILLIKSLASEISSIKNEKFEDIQFLKTEMNRLSQCLKSIEMKETTGFYRTNNTGNQIPIVFQKETCNFCNHLEHKIKNCINFQKSKLEKDLKPEPTKNCILFM